MGWVSAAGMELDRDTRERLNLTPLIELVLGVRPRLAALEAEVAQLRGELEHGGDGERERHEQPDRHGEGRSIGWDVLEVAAAAGEPQRDCRLESGGGVVGDL